MLFRMESTEKCEAIITHFNGKYIKTPPGVPGETSGNQAESHMLFFAVKILEEFCMSISLLIEVGLSCLSAFCLASPI